MSPMKSGTLTVNATRPPGTDPSCVVWDPSPSLVWDGYTHLCWRACVVMYYRPELDIQVSDTGLRVNTPDGPRRMPGYAITVRTRLEGVEPASAKRLFATEASAQRWLIAVQHHRVDPLADPLADSTTP